VKTTVFSKLTLALLPLFIGACSLSRPVYLNTLRPADIHLDSTIQTLLLVDRTQFDRNDWLSIGEGLLTGELPYEDRAAAQEALNSLKNKLQESPRYQIVIARERLKGNSLSAAFPPPLSRESQRDLQRQYQADALLCIEIMDSDFIVTDGKRKVKRTVGEGDNQREVEVDEWYAEGVGDLKLGFRLYDIDGNNIVDQELISENKVWRAAAASKAEALAKLLGKAEATRQLCRMTGEDYAFKIAPLPIQLERVFFRKAKKNPGLEEGARLAEVNDWEKAIAVWKQALPSATGKDAGRLAHNIAVAYEVLGYFPEAREWAQKAYARYGDRRSRDYVRTLEQRILDERRLEQQMQERNGF